MIYNYCCFIGQYNDLVKSTIFTEPRGDLVTNLYKHIKLSGKLYNLYIV